MRKRALFVYLLSLMCCAFVIAQPSSRARAAYEQWRAQTLTARPTLPSHHALAAVVQRSSAERAMMGFYAVGERFGLTLAVQPLRTVQESIYDKIALTSISLPIPAFDKQRPSAGKERVVFIRVESSNPQMRGTLHYRLAKLSCKPPNPILPKCFIAPPIVLSALGDETVQVFVAIVPNNVADLALDALGEVIAEMAGMAAAKVVQKDDMLNALFSDALSKLGKRLAELVTSPVLNSIRNNVQVLANSSKNSAKSLAMSLKTKYSAGVQAGDFEVVIVPADVAFRPGKL